MKKKILSLLVAICMIVPMTISLVACGEKETPAGTEATKQSTMASDNITLSYSSTVYDGTEKKPDVTVKYDDEVVSSENYTVVYEDNINAGTATVTVTSNADSEILEEGLIFTTHFEIERAPILVHNIGELNASILVTDSNHVIKLGDNIALERNEKNKVIPVLIYPENKDYDIAIDLAGFDINSYIDIRSIYNKVTSEFGAKVKIYNSTSAESVVGALDNSVDYAIQVQTAAAFDVELENVKFQAYWGGIATNGSAYYINEKTNVYAKNCKFIATKESAVDGEDAGVGAYLPAGKYVYTFDTCEFEGYSGYYAKSGHHTLKNCRVTAFGAVKFDPSRNNDGSNQTGSAIIIDSCEGYNLVPAAGYQKGLTVDIIGGRYTSASNYGLEEFSTYELERVSYAFIHVTDDAIFEGKAGAYNVENDAMVIGLDVTHHHTYNHFLAHNSTHHFERCYCGTIRNETAHNWVYVETLEEATFEENGVKKYRCDACGREKTSEYVFATDRTAIYVSTAEELNNAIKTTDASHVIVLSNNIVDRDSNGKVIPIVIYETVQDRDIAIDLNGFSINSHISVRTTVNNVKTDKKVNVLIFNSTNRESIVGASDDSVDYAFRIFSSVDNVIKLKNVKFEAYWGGLYTNGSYVSQTNVNALNCKFIATKENAVGGAGVGAYIVSPKHIYIFENCEFEGFGGYYTKNGHQKLINCTVKAVGTLSFVPSHNPSGGNQTGSALVVDSCENQDKGAALGYEKSLTIEIIGGTFTSVSKYAIEEYSTYETIGGKICYSEITISGDVELRANNSLASAISSENGVIEELN